MIAALLGGLLVIVLLLVFVGVPLLGLWFLASIGNTGAPTRRERAAYRRRS